LHGLYWRNRAGNVIFGLLEDGGEMLVISMILVLLVGIVSATNRYPTIESPSNFNNSN
jgi:hypothetical protein